MLYYLSRFFVSIFMHIVFRIKVEGRENIISDGPIVICSNHVTAWDPLFVAITFPQPVCYMAKAELFENKIANWFFRSVYVFPVKRGGNDLHAIKSALSILKQGHTMGLFPEGTRHTDGQEHEAKSGVAMLAYKGGARIQPVALTGNIKPFGHVCIHIGKPISYDHEAMGKPTNDDYKAMTKELMHVIEGLKK